ncbi:Cys-Gln thioester bond-forming surface protein [Streptomyces xanthochromogenes]|uniref:TQXA domain-containing protein n=1 Tax=Streptomyces xanthochromogenes TaxID=67384 RepID=A0ABQ2ZQ01_9ACTN|nr:Cys-Gln thioester bond-forming surface protein [Streptomyces xanthochromogenes]MYV95897.1 Cys-Gln thioester bond-forming surface protein [Streptomyces sp. SID1034]GGY22395.1 TQXA domain-containing protein [Streptomyces xanthochromogenes]
MFSAVNGPSARKRGALRLATATAVTGLLAAGAIAGAGTSFADTPDQQGQGGATATIQGLEPGSFADAIITNGRETEKVSAGLFRMNVDGGGTLRTYCIDIHNPTQREAKYRETPWSGTSLATNKDAGKIRWILENSYPQKNDLGQLAKDAGVSGKLNNAEAAAATQVAIWRYSDGAQVKAKNKDAEKLAEWLYESAKVVEEPKASLTLDNASVAGKAGQKLGPVTVHTNADKVTVTASEELKAAKVQVVDEGGKAVTSAVNNSKLYFNVPAGTQPGAGSLRLSATTQVPVGRAFASDSKSQTQILAGSSDSTVNAEAKVSWAKQGAIPAVTVKKDCAKGGVDITVTNKGDEAFPVTVGGKTVATVPAGGSKTVLFPVAEDEKYDFTIAGQHFSGTLDCKTAGTPSTPPSSKPSPASAGGSSTGTNGTNGTTGGTNLAETGSSSSTPMIAGAAVVLVLLGGGAVFFLRKKKTAGH